MTKVKETLEQRMARVAEYAKNNPMLMIEIEIPPCPKCGRLIACGVERLCGDSECPQKFGDKNNG